MGLDPEVPPKTIEEVNEFSKRINVVRDGLVQRIGILPWDSYGFSNSIFTWGWAFGGSLYDREKQEVTPDDEGVVKALEWMTDYAQSVGGPDRISVTPPNLQLHYFGGGNVAMSPLVSPNARDVEESTDLRTGAGLLPYAPPAEAPGAGAWIGGWSLFVPKGAPYVSAAWEFAYWLSATDAGTKAQWDTVGFPPAYRRAPVLKEIQQDPLMGPFYDTLVTAQHSRPAIPVGSFYTTQLDQLVGDAIYGRLSPLAALREAKKNTMIEWDRFNRQLGITE
ncbi:MAG: extracellular solute-binding protein [Chloroflexia bacterium]